MYKSDITGNEPNTAKIIWRDSVYIRGRAFNKVGSLKATRSLSGSKKLARSAITPSEARRFLSVKKPPHAWLAYGGLFVLGDYLRSRASSARSSFSSVFRQCLRHSSRERVRRAFCIAVVIRSVREVASAITTATRSRALSISDLPTFRRVRVQVRPRRGLGLALGSCVRVLAWLVRVLRVALWLPLVCLPMLHAFR